MTTTLAAPAPATEVRLFTPAFIAVAFASLAYFTGIGALIPTLPRYVAGPLGGGPVAVGLVVGAFSISAVLVRPLAGRIGDQRGRRPLLFAGALLFAASTVLYGVVASPATLVAVRLLSGAGEALFFVGATTVFADLAPPQRRGEAMSLASLALYVGIGVGPMFGETALRAGGFASVWWLTAGCGVVAALLVLRVPETRPAAVPAGSAAPGADAAAPGGAAARGAPASSRPRPRWVHPAGVLPGVLLGSGIVGMAGFLTFVPFHADAVGLSGSSGVLLVFAAVVVAIRSLGAKLPDVLGPRRSITIALVATAAGLATMALWQQPIGLVSGTAALGVGIAMLTPSVFALAVASAPATERAQVMGTTSAFIDVAFGVGPVSLGAIAIVAGAPGVFAGASAVALLGLLVVARSGLERRDASPAARSLA